MYVESGVALLFLRRRLAPLFRGELVWERGRDGAVGAPHLVVSCIINIMYGCNGPPLSTCTARSTTSIVIPRRSSVMRRGTIEREAVGNDGRSGRLAGGRAVVGAARVGGARVARIGVRDARRALAPVPRAGLPLRERHRHLLGAVHRPPRERRRLLPPRRGLERRRRGPRPGREPAAGGRRRRVRVGHPAAGQRGEPPRRARGRQRRIPHGVLRLLHDGAARAPPRAAAAAVAARPSAERRGTRAAAPSLRAGTCRWCS